MHYIRRRRAGLIQVLPPLTLAERLAARVVRAESGCLEWTGGHDGRGYGRIGAGGHDGPTLNVPRLAWALAHPGEPMPPVIRHTCDNPPCCEPTHLIAGTIADNAHDAVERGRVAQGEGHGRARLTDSQVASLRAEYAAGGVTQTALALKYGISGSHAHRIIRNKRRGKDSFTVTA